MKKHKRNLQEMQRIHLTFQKVQNLCRQGKRR